MEQGEMIGGRLLSAYVTVEPLLFDPHFTI